MTTKAILRKRLGVAIGKTVSPKDFTWFFDVNIQKSPAKYPLVGDFLAHIKKKHYFCGGFEIARISNSSE